MATSVSGQPDQRGLACSRWADRDCVSSGHQPIEQRLRLRSLDRKPGDNMACNHVHPAVEAILLNRGREVDNLGDAIADSLLKRRRIDRLVDVVEQARNLRDRQFGRCVACPDPVLVGEEGKPAAEDRLVCDTGSRGELELGSEQFDGDLLGGGHDDEVGTCEELVRVDQVVDCLRDCLLCVG